MTRLLPVAFLLLTAAPTFAQDTVQPAFGNAAGTAFDERAPANRRIGQIEVNSGTLVDGIRLLYENRNGGANGASPQVGLLTGVTSTFTIPTGDYLERIDVWTNGTFLVRVALETHGGLRTAFGGVGTGHARYNFFAPAGEEIVGLVGTYGALMQSLGVVTRPVLASHEFFGTGCPTTVGVPQIRYRSTNPHLVLGTVCIVEVTNSPSNNGAIGLGFSTTSIAGVPLPLPLDGYNLPGCTLYVSLDDIIFSAGGAGVFGYSIVVPSAQSLVGISVSFQGFPFGAPFVPVAASNALTAMVGAL